MPKNQRSALKEFLSSISTISGDLSNITAPPFLLASQSTVEFPSYWAEYPKLFVAPAQEPDPLKRTVLVLKSFLATLKRQQYAGRDPKDGVKKPLNAFLGELFLAECNDGDFKIRLVCEQVSHHPPVTACCLWNEEFGVKAEGFACQEITFSGNVNIQQKGHAIVHLDQFDEDYLVPLPNVKVSGLLTGSAYPELTGAYEIISSAGYVAEIDFSGKKMMGIGGERNHVYAAVYDTNSDSGRKSPLYSAQGSWSGTFTIRNETDGTEFEKYDTTANPANTIQTEPIEKQDPWESRNAWRQTIDALESGNMQSAAAEKSKVEEGQRRMRKAEESEGRPWKQVFFKQQTEDATYRKLAAMSKMPNEDHPMGFWTFMPEKARSMKRPFHGTMKPTTAQDKVSDGQVVGATESHGKDVMPSEPKTSEAKHRISEDIPRAQNSAKFDRVETNPYSKRPLDPRLDAKR